MSLAFLTTAPASEAAVARSPMAVPAARAGARVESRHGWEVAVAYGTDPAAEAARAAQTVAFADSCHITKRELQGPSAALDSAAAAAGALGATGDTLPFGEARRDRSGAWWCRLTQTRALVLGGPAGALQEPAGLRAVDVTSTFGAATVVGPLARDLFARFCALDLRPDHTPVGALRPGSIARQPGVLVREAGARYLFLFGAAYGEYIWETLADAAQSLGGGPIGAGALDALEASDA